MIKPREMKCILPARIALALALVFPLSVSAQDNVGIGTTTPHPQAILELVSSNQGFLMARMNSTDTSIAGLNQQGMMFFAQDVQSILYYNGTSWQVVSSGINYWGDNGTDIFNLNTGGVAIGANSTALKFQVIDNLASANPVMGIENQNSSGDVSYGMRNSGSATSYTMGIDASDGSKFKISNSTTLGTNDAITVQNTSIGIGTTAPLALLHVEGSEGAIRFHPYWPDPTNKTSLMMTLLSATNTGSQLRFQRNDLTFTDIGNDSSGNFVIQTNSDQTRFTVLQNGNIGIGTTEPDEPLTVGEPLGSGWTYDAVITAGSTTNGGAIELGTATNSISIEHGDIWNRARIISSDAGGFGQGDIQFRVGGIGISETTPQSKLDVSGNVTVGSGYSGSFAAPTDGMIVEGALGIGISSFSTIYKVFVNVPGGGSTRYGLISQNQYDGASAGYGLFSLMTGAGTGARYALYLSSGSTTSGAEYGVFSTGEDYDYFAGAVGIGQTVPTAKFEIQNGGTTYATSMILNNTYSGSSVKYGINNTVSNAGTAPRYGILNTVSGNGDVTYGTYNNMLTNSTAYGTYNFVQASTGGTKYGTYNSVSGASGVASAIYASRSYAFHSGTGNVYGNYIDANKASGQSGTLYGLYVISDNDGTGNSYLLYANSIGSTSGNEYGLYVTGEDYNYISGYFGINTTVPAYNLHVTDNSNAKVYNIYTENTYNGNFDARAIYGRAVTNPGYGYGAEFRGGYRGIYGFGDGGSYTGGVRGVYGYASGSTGSRYGVYGFASGGTTNYGLYCSGSGAYTGTWTDVSDQRFKTNVQDLDPVLDKVLRLSPRTYTYFDNAETQAMGLIPNESEIGLISNEVEAIFPELVEDEVHPGIEGEDGRANNPINYKGMNYIGLTPILVKAIQEQQELIEGLKARIEELEKK